jgi:hypothetical protein
MLQKPQCSRGGGPLELDYCRLVGCWQILFLERRCRWGGRQSTLRGVVLQSWRRVYTQAWLVEGGADRRGVSSAWCRPPRAERLGRNLRRRFRFCFWRVLAGGEPAG